MKRVFLPLLFPALLLGATWELGGGGGLVFLDRSTQGAYLQNQDENLPRLFLRGGYQLTPQSDQLFIAIASDKRIDELDLGYNLMLPSMQPYAPLRALPYAKASLAIGNTHADWDTLSHMGAALGLGLIGHSGEQLRVRFELEYRMREGQLERGGQEPNGELLSWRDRELNFLIGLALLF